MKSITAVYLFIVILTVTLVPCRQELVTTVTSILSVTATTAKVVSDLWTKVINNPNATNAVKDVVSSIGEVKEAIVMKQMAELYKLVGKIQETNEANFEALSVSLRSIPNQVKLEIRLSQLATYTDLIDGLNEQMDNYAQGKGEFEKFTLENFASQVVSHNGDSVRNIVERIDRLVFRNRNDVGLFRLVEKSLKEVEGDMRCNTKQSPQQVLFNLYKSIALTELKGYMMMQFSYMLLKLYNKGNFTKEALIMKERYAERTAAAIQSVKEAMADASKEYWRCDPPKHVLNETYVEITNLLQGYVQNEVDLNPEGTCRENCAYYSYTKSHSCFQNLYCQQQRRCNGRIIDCQFIDSDAWICPADSKSGRRYEYIEYENGRTLGRKQGCPKGPVKVDSWWRWLFWHCSYCFCLCDEESVYSDRYFNMRAVIADVLNNRVVTGLRFVKNNRIIHLQIQEGKLLPGGEIDVATVHWVPVENYRITDKNVFNGQDYHTLTATEREIDLDDLVADDGHVVTGVRFKKLGQHLNFEIYITPFNFSSGQLTDPFHMSVWKDNLISSRKSLNMEKLDVPIRSPLPSVPDSKSEQVLQFTYTDMDRDASQTTVPFIDAQPVELMMPVPLSGAGIYHKGRPHFGGYIAPKIMTYDYSKHLQPGLPEDAEKVN